VVVPNLHRSVLFVPSPAVFDDASGELAALEAAVAADPSKKMELLQVRLGQGPVRGAGMHDRVMCAASNVKLLTCIRLQQRQQSVLGLAAS
jgi:hypothetical protein